MVPGATEITHVPSMTLLVELSSLNDISHPSSHETVTEMFAVWFQSVNGSTSSRVMVRTGHPSSVPGVVGQASMSSATESKSRSLCEGEHPFPSAISIDGVSGQSSSSFRTPSRSASFSIGAQPSGSTWGTGEKSHSSSLSMIPSLSVSSIWAEKVTHLVSV